MMPLQYRIYFSGSAGTGLTGKLLVHLYKEQVGLEFLGTMQFRHKTKPPNQKQILLYRCFLLEINILFILYLIYTYFLSNFTNSLIFRFMNPLSNEDGPIGHPFIVGLQLKIAFRPKILQKIGISPEVCQLLFSYKFFCIK